MRPRHKAAEYVGARDVDRAGLDHASMRPRHKAAEYHPRGWDAPARSSRFNEAAA